MTSRTPRPRIGVSSCLIGEPVRFDGNHKLDRFIRDELAEVFELVPTCPEVAIGLGTPRPPIRLVQTEDGIRAQGVQDAALDVTNPLSDYGRRRARELGDLVGYVFKARSPSCGLFGTPVYSTGRKPLKRSGLYANAIQSALPLLPVEEEGRLRDTGLRDNFLERVFAYQRWREHMADGVTLSKLVTFHSQHKLSLMAHGPVHVTELGRLVAQTEDLRPKQLGERYLSHFLHALHFQATAKRHTNVLHHVMGYLKKSISPLDKQELLDCIEQYRIGQLPRIAPLTLLRHHFRHHPNPYIAQQHYLYPAPEEARLRSPL